MPLEIAVTAAPFRRPKLSLPDGRVTPLFKGLSVLALLLLLLPGRAGAAEQVVLAFGDSLTAGHGLRAEDGFPARLEEALLRRGLTVRVENAGVSGDTTAGGRARLDWVLSGPVDLVILELGANDGLRGVNPAVTRRNLDAMLDELTGRGIKVLLAGMRAPPNLGRSFGRSFNRIYDDLAEKHQVALYPFFLDGVAARPSLNQADGLHPNAKGVAEIVRRILPHVVRLLDE
ncbi:MAG: arylesterase [Alphaproteobacteria bacterium]|jgi:acyl-CoA thioesterase-1|nr:arylesterase [Alphaproteobacteria bacterium]MDP6567520.1 arylesterase [Alphaproteobacteria bacterium]MDP6813175.1 arylesterase [Alphaproteobacteria bacterium]